MLITKTTWMRELEKIIGDNLDNPKLNNQWLANQLCFSERTFYKKVKDAYSISPHRYITKARLSKAKELLQNKKAKTVTEACFAVGFTKVEYFSSIFYREFKQHPSEICHKIRKSAEMGGMSS